MLRSVRQLSFFVLTAESETVLRKIKLVYVSVLPLGKVIYIRLAIVACPDGKRSQYTTGFGKRLVEMKVKRKSCSAKIHT